jgi:hypothetical protein
MSDDNLLFHYTSLQGFLGIIQSGCLWASHINFLNDSTEGSMFLDALETAMRNDSTAPETITPLVIDNVRVAIEEFCWWKIPRFSVSFCNHHKENEVKDGVLSQWRGYGEGGVALVFDKAKLLAACQILTRETGWNHSLKPVRYVRSAEDVLKKLNHVNFNLFDVLKFSHDFTFRSEDNLHIENKDFKPFVDALINIAPFMKHASFEEEQEYRLAIAPDYFERNVRLAESLRTGIWNRLDLNIKYRINSGKIVPYLESLKFRSTDIYSEHPVPQGLANSLIKVIIGPSKMSVHNYMAAKALLSGQNVDVTVSGIPLQ